MNKQDLKEFIINTRDEKNLDIIVEAIHKDFGNVQKTFGIRDIKKYISNTRNTYNNVQNNKPINSESEEKIVTIDKSSLRKNDSLVKAAGFNIDEYMISNAWVKGNGLSVHIKKKQGVLTREDWEDIFKNIKPISIPHSKKPGKYNYLINIADMHLGITKFEHIVEVLTHIQDYFQKEGTANKICINLLGDEFNTAIVGKSQTNEGTQLNKTYGRQALKDADKFFDTLFRILIPNCNELHVHNTYGNHDGGNSFNYLHGLSRLYKNVHFHLSYEDVLQRYRDYYLLDKVGVMITHGDLGKGRFEGAFEKEAWEVYRNSTTRIILTGHLHKEKIIETDLGNKIYQIGTNKAIDNWSNKNIFLLSKTERNWNIFKLNETELEGTQYI
jgi:UDP-2,3-diacylglucosamine pyrophosphatase LpxH